MMNIRLGEISELRGLCAQRHSNKTVEYCEILRYLGTLVEGGQAQKLNFTDNQR